MRKMIVALILTVMLVNLVKCKVDYESAKYITQYEQKLGQCIKDIGYFSCSTMGKNQDVVQNCQSAIRNYNKCVMSTVFDAEYIEFKQGATFNYTQQFYDYALLNSGECERDPLVLKYTNMNQSTKNYIEEKQDCFDKNTIIYNKNLPLTDIAQTLQYCINTHPKCDSPCQDKVTQYDSCIASEEKKFSVSKNFWDIQSLFLDFKKSIYTVCANGMKAQYDQSPQFKHYVNCIQKQLDSSFSKNLISNIFLVLFAFSVIYYVI